MATRRRPPPRLTVTDWLVIRDSLSNWVLGKADDVALAEDDPDPNRRAVARAEYDRANEALIKVESRLRRD